MSSVTPFAVDHGPGLARQVAHRSQFLERLTWGLIRASTEQDVTDFVVELILRDTSAQSCWLMLTDRSSGELSISGERSTSGVLPELDPKFATWVATSGTTLRFDEIQTDDRCDSGFDLHTDVSALLCMPVVASNRVLGVLSLSSPSPGAFSDEDQRSLSKAAEHVGAALDRARRSNSLRSSNDTVLSSQIDEYRERLIQAEKMSSLGGLLAGIVHELNNPLTTILGFAQLLARTSGDNKNLDTIISESERCARIVQSVLRIARRGTAGKEAVDLNTSVRETLELASYQLRLNQVTLGLNLTPKDPRVSVNPNEFTQVLLNLVTNAVQAIAGSDNETGRVGVTTQVVGDRVSIQVEDSGPGMDPDRLARIFDPFFTTREAGTGLGLSLSRQMIEDNDGSIRVDSTEGHGATFTIELPLAQDSSVDQTEEVNRKRVLVVDDEHHILELVKAVLADDFVVECASSGEEGIELLDASDYDLLISDLRMPGIGGVELVDWARENEKDPRVLLLTGDIVSKDVREFMASSGASCLSKPFKIEELVTAVEELLESDGGSAQAGEQ